MKICEVDAIIDALMVYFMRDIKNAFRVSWVWVSSDPQDILREDVEIQPFFIGNKKEKQ